MNATEPTAASAYERIREMWSLKSPLTYESLCCSHSADAYEEYKARKYTPAEKAVIKAFDEAGFPNVIMSWTVGVFAKGNSTKQAIKKAKEVIANERNTLKALSDYRTHIIRVINELRQHITAGQLRHVYINGDPITLYISNPLAIEITAKMPKHDILVRIYNYIEDSDNPKKRIGRQTVVYHCWTKATDEHYGQQYPLAKASVIGMLRNREKKFCVA